MSITEDANTWTESVVETLLGMSDPARTIGMSLLFRLPDGTPVTDWRPFNRGSQAHADAFAELPEKRELLNVFYPDLVDAILLAFESRGDIPLLAESIDSPFRRSPTRPELANLGFINWLTRITRDVAGLPKDALWLAEHLPDGTSDSALLGALLGFASDLPNEHGQQVFDALVQTVQGKNPNSFPGRYLIGALISTRREEAWRHLAEMQIAGRFNENMRGYINSFLWGGRLGAARVLLETAEDRNRNFKPKYPGEDTWLANFLAGVPRDLALLDAAAREAAYTSGTHEEVDRALQIQARIDLMGVAPAARRLIASLDSGRRVLGVSAFGYYSVRDQLFSAELLEDPDELVADAALYVAYAANFANPQDALDRLGHVLGRLQGKATLPLRDIATAHNAMFVAIGAGPLDPLAPFFTNMSVSLRRDLAGMLASPERMSRPLTRTEMGILGALSANKSPKVREAAEAALQTRGVNPADAAAAAAELPKPPKTPRRPKGVKPPPKGPFVKLLEKRAADHDTTYEFGPPATEDLLAAAEQKLGTTMPDTLRAFLLEANGVWDGDALIMPSEEITETTIDLRDECEEFDPPRDVSGILFFLDYGNGDYAGICATPLHKHKLGEIVRFDHETGKIEKLAKDLKAFLKLEEI